MKKILFLAAMTFAVLFTSCKKDDDAGLYNVAVTAGEGGIVAADNGKHKEGEELTIVAIPNNGYTFSCWSDGVKNNPRIVTVQNTDIVLVALFAKDNSNGNGGDSNESDNNGGNSLDDNIAPEQYLTKNIWEGSLPVRSNYDARTNSSRFSFVKEKDGSKHGTEKTYVNGVLEQTYRFLWYWYDDSHNVLVLNYGGEWAEDKCCIDIKEMENDHIYGYFYSTLDDYENYKEDSKKYSIGTKVELGLAEVEEHFNFSNLTVIANADGTICVAGRIETNTKIKEFCLYNADGTVAYDILKDNEQVKEKNNELDDNGRAFEGKSFELEIQSKTLPVALYTMAIKTKKSKGYSEGIATIGEDYAFNVGTGSNRTLGSQISLVDQKCYLLADFYDSTTGEVNDKASTIEVYLAEDLKLAAAKGLKVATTTNEVRYQEKADANRAKLADAKIFPNVVFTTTGCIATYTLTKVDDVTYTLSGVMINSKGNYKVDVSSAFNY